MCNIRKRSHQWIDLRSLTMAKVIADRLRADPSLMDVARRNLVRWRKTLSVWPNSLEEWAAILERDSLEEVLQVLLDSGESGSRMRQSSPFTGIMTSSERKAIFTQHETAGT